MNESENPIHILNSNSDSSLYEYKHGIERITLELMKFGLTKTQAKVFIYLGKYGSMTSPQVCKDLKLPRTETYHILNSLANRGIVVSEFSHPARYSAISLEKAISTMITAEQVKVNLLSEHEKEIAELWKAIPCFFHKSKESESDKFQMLQGSPRIYNKMKDMISNGKNRCKLVCSGKDLSRFYYSNLIEMVNDLSLDLKLIISSNSIIPHIVKNMNESKVRYNPLNMANNQCFLIKDNDELLIFLKNANFPASKIFAFWTDSKSLIDCMHLLFNYTWKNSKRIEQEKLIISKNYVTKT